jgi:hypothetical protein
VHSSKALLKSSNVSLQVLMSLNLAIRMPSTRSQTKQEAVDSIHIATARGLHYAVPSSHSNDSSLRVSLATKLPYAVGGASATAVKQKRGRAQTACKCPTNSDQPVKRKGNSAESNDNRSSRYDAPSSAASEALPWKLRSREATQTDVGDNAKQVDTRDSVKKFSSEALLGTTAQEKYGTTSCDLRHRWPTADDYNLEHALARSALNANPDYACLEGCVGTGAEFIRTHKNSSDHAGNEVCNCLRRELKFLAEKEHCEGARRIKSAADYFIGIQDQIQPFMRREMFEWNIEVADRHMRLTTEALHLAFNYFDRYLSLVPCAVEHLQLMSLACMWVSSKVCASDNPVATGSQLAEFTRFPTAAIILMERTLLSHLKYNVTPVVTVDYIRLLLPFVQCPLDQRGKLFQYVENISLAQAMVHPLLNFNAATIAATAVVLGANYIAGRLHAGVDNLLLSALVQLIDSTLVCALDCHRVTCAHIILENLVMTADEAPEIAAIQVDKANQAANRNGAKASPLPAARSRSTAC